MGLAKKREIDPISVIHWEWDSAHEQTNERHFHFNVSPAFRGTTTESPKT